MAKKKRNKKKNNVNRNNVNQSFANRGQEKNDNRAQVIYNQMASKGTDTEGYEEVLIENNATAEELEELLEVSSIPEDDSIAESIHDYLRTIL